MMGDVGGKGVSAMNQLTFLCINRTSILLRDVGDG